MSARPKERLDRRFMAALCLAATAGVVNNAALVANETPTGQGTTMVINESIFALGVAAGAASGGLLIEVGGFRALGFGMPVFALLAAMSVWRPGAATRSELDVSVVTAGEDVL